MFEIEIRQLKGMMKALYEDKEFATLAAKITKKLCDALVAEGFNRREAIAIISKQELISSAK